jgi:tetratricopeptide (TPR) repeat protein
MKGSKPLVLLVLLLCLGCDASTWRKWWLSSNQKDIDKASKSIETARTDAERAEGYSERGAAYAERSRYSKAFHLIAADEYERLFGLAIADHDRAIALAPQSSQAYLNRGLAYYHRATLLDLNGPEAKQSFAAADSDFTKAIERDGRNALAFDMRGVVDSVLGDHDRAIADFTQVMAIDAHLGKLRLAEAYCVRAGVHQKAGNYDAAISDYEKSISFRVGGDGCDCQPESPLAWIYLETHQYDKSWAVVKRAKESRRWIAPEVIEQLKTAQKAPPITAPA